MFDSVLKHGRPQDFFSKVGKLRAWGRKSAGFRGRAPVGVWGSDDRL